MVNIRLKINIISPAMIILLFYANASFAKEGFVADTNTHRLPWGTIAQKLKYNVLPSIQKKDGFYNIKFTAESKRTPRENEVYVIGCRNWKKDILSFCRNMKEEIESNPDPQLIRSSITISHIDNTMEMISQASGLSNGILMALADTVYSKNAFDEGMCPDFVIGLNNLKLKRFPGGSLAEFVLLIPPNYDEGKKWPLFIHVDPPRWAVGEYVSSKGMLDIWWHSIGHKKLQWKEYQLLLGIMNNKLNIDKDRIYVNGECANGMAAMALALNYPDQWAECSMSLGNSFRHLAGNAWNLPLIYVKGGYDDDRRVGYYNFAAKCFNYYSCRYFTTSKTFTTTEARGTALPYAIRETNPQRVLLLCESLICNKAYWLQIDGRSDENTIALIDATISGQTIYVKHKNIDAYSIDLKIAPLDETKPIDIVEIPLQSDKDITTANDNNDQNYSLSVTDNDILRFHCDLTSTSKTCSNVKAVNYLGVISDDLIFSRKPLRYLNASYVKTSKLSGPLKDTFTNAYVVVYGTAGKDAAFIESCKKVAKIIAAGAPCIADANVTPDIISTYNIIFIGTPQSNSLLAKITEELPVQIKGGNVFANNQKFTDEDMGFLVIYPNPLNPQRYILVFSANSTKAMTKSPEAFLQVNDICPADIGIYQVTDQGRLKWHILEKFDTTWNWHSQYDNVITTIENKHPQWQWQQWVAQIVRKQFDADVVICEDHFKFADSLPIGQFTYRDLFNAFKNDWFVKIRLDGRSLRELLTVPFNTISERNVNVPIIDGISMVKQNTMTPEATLSFAELIDNKRYAAVFPYKCLNGQRLGLALDDYEILDQDFLISLLKEYFKNPQNQNIDKQLDNIKLNIF